MTVMKFLLATRSKDTDEESAAAALGIQSVLQDLYGVDGPRILVQPASVPFNAHRADGGGFRDWPERVVTCRASDYSGEYDFAGIIVPLIGEEGPRLADPFLGKVTAEILELAFAERKDEMLLYAADNVCEDNWEFYPIRDLEYYKAPAGKKSAPWARWADMDLDIEGVV